MRLSDNIEQPPTYLSPPHLPVFMVLYRYRYEAAYTAPLLPFALYGERSYKSYQSYKSLYAVAVTAFIDVRRPSPAAAPVPPKLVVTCLFNSWALILGKRLLSCVPLLSGHVPL